MHRPTNSRSATLLDPLDRAHSSGVSRPRIIRELIIFGSAILIGVIGVPLLTWVAGDRILGPYVHGSNPHAGPMALLGDFFEGLSHGAMTFWVVALGPTIIIVFVRLAWAAIKYNPRTRPSVAKDRL